MTQRMDLRSCLHVLAGFGALPLRWLSPAAAVAWLLLLIATNAWLLPRWFGQRLWKRSDHRRGASPGLLAYPVALLVVSLVCWGRPVILAGAWGLLAFGDGLAGWFGRRSDRRLPWNPAKTWGGWLACWAGGAAGCLALIAWVRWAPNSGLAGLLAQATDTHTLFAVGLAALVVAVVESWPSELEDNFAVTWAGAAVLAAGMSQGVDLAALLAAEWWVRFGLALVASTSFGLFLLQLGQVDRSGLIAGVALASIVGGSLGVQGWVLLATFVALAGAAGAWRGARNTARKATPNPSSGSPRRRARNVFANGAVATIASLVAYASSNWMWKVAFASALAAAAADTVAGEVGQRAGGSTRRITDGRSVAPGTDGGVSWLGSTAGVAVTTGMAALGAWLDLYPPGAAGWVALAGFFGCGLDSLLGATLEGRGVLDNEGVNVVATYGAALLGFGMVSWTMG